MIPSFPASRVRKVLTKLAALYADMDAAYVAAAGVAGLSCAGCAENCCTSYFQHHTHVEWLYLLAGIQELPEARRAGYLARARTYGEETAASLARGEIPRLMCPVNDDGRCGLYGHRLMEEGKPEAIAEKIVEGRIKKFYKEICLLEQPFIKDDKVSIKDLLNELVGVLGENVQIGRFTRMALGEEA